MWCGPGMGAIFFFFQAKAGIRYLTVTGVQTCALPIYRRGSGRAEHAGRGADGYERTVRRRIVLPGGEKSGCQAHRRGGAGCGMVTRPKRSEEHTSELQSQSNLVCRLLLEKKKKNALLCR